MRGYLMRGVPASVRMDAWWMSGEAPEVPPVDKPQGGLETVRRAPVRLVLLLALILLADWLFWGYGVGVSLVLFGVALAAALWLAAGRRDWRRRDTLAALVFGVGLLPVLDYMQGLSVLFYIGSLTGFAIWVALNGQGRMADLLQAGARFWLLAPVQVLRDAGAGGQALVRGQDMRGLLRAWGLPMVAGAVFLSLFAAGNPVFENLLLRIPDFGVDEGRLLFWGLIAALVWPFLVLHKMRQRMRVPFPLPVTSRLSIPALFNPQSVVNSLVLFNLMFALQTGLDAVYLWGHAELPSGVSPAAFAHRGAYPLVLTALLAGLFAMVSRPYVQDRRGVRALLLLWLGQNVALMAGAVLRLDLYVEAYGLTYLRVAAFIWMGMVAAGLALIGWQVLRGAGNGWMLVRMAGLLVVVLYLCSFVNFADMIARFNLSREPEIYAVQGGDRAPVRLDGDYICDLGSMAMPAIADYQQQTGQPVCAAWKMPAYPEIDNWREWGFRKWRVRRYLAADTAMENKL
ncbi:DUF4153 domain-containing protein [Profundibacter sp.]|uniref:DUF4153 domain-containing protein n=1 Tax=Profundibacter sp. TaxID=3101071 RepID=UPI003D0FBE41